MTPDQLEQYLLTLWPAPSKQALARYMARESVPRRIKVKGQVYRKAETLADKLLALAVEIQDYAIPDLDKWTDLTNRMLAIMEQGKNEIEVAGKKFTAQQLYDTLVRIFKQTQAQHQQLWIEKEKSRKKRLDQLPSSSRKLPEFYRDPEMMKPVLESKPVVIKPFAAANELVYRGAVYRLAAPPLRSVPDATPRSSTGDPEVDKAHMAAQRGLDESQAALQNFHYEWRSGMAMFQRLSAQLQKLSADVDSQDAAVKQAKQNYHATKEDIAYYQEVLERLGRMDPQDRAWLRDHSWLS